MILILSNEKKNPFVKKIKEGIYFKKQMITEYKGK